MEEHIAKDADLVDRNLPPPVFQCGQPFHHYHSVGTLMPKPPKASNSTMAATAV